MAAGARILKATSPWNRPEDARGPGGVVAPGSLPPAAAKRMRPERSRRPVAQEGVMKRKEKISQQEVNAAIQSFLQRGGLIEKLPDQNVEQRQKIGEEKYEVYEALSDLPILN